MDIMRKAQTLEKVLLVNRISFLEVLDLQECNLGKEQYRVFVKTDQLLGRVRMGLSCRALKETVSVFIL